MLSYFSNEYMITEWVYRRGDSETPTRITSREDHRDAGSLTFSLNHHGDDRKFRLWFTDVAVKFHGSGTWTPAD